MYKILIGYAVIVTAYIFIGFFADAMSGYKLPGWLPKSAMILLASLAMYAVFCLCHFIYNI